MKKYKLLKDTHFGKAGNILIYSPGQGGYFLKDDNQSFFTTREIENNPEWFEEITTPWVWSDELVQEYVDYSINHLMTECASDLKKDWFMDSFKSERSSS